MIQKEVIAKILIVFGIVTILTSIIDMSVALLPLHLNVPQWVYLVIQDIGEISFIPILAILAIIGGLYLSRIGNSRFNTIIKNAVAAFSTLMAVGLISGMFVFVTAMHTVESNVITTIENEAKKAKVQLAQLVRQSSDIKEEQLITTINNIDEKVNKQVNIAKADFFKKNIRTMSNLTIFMIFYLFVGIKLFGFSIVKVNKQQLNSAQSTFTLK